MTESLVRVVETCPGMPSQWDAWTADGTQLYLRYRHGRGSVEVGDGMQIHAEVVASWNDGTGDSWISLTDFLAAAGLQLADGAEVRPMNLDYDSDPLPEPGPTPFIDGLLAEYRARRNP